MQFLQAGYAFAIFGWISLALQAGWITLEGERGLLPVALDTIGLPNAASILFFLGAASASWLLLRQD